MSLQWQLSREIPTGSVLLGQKIFPEQNFYCTIGDPFDQPLPGEQVFAPLYHSQGPGAISPLLLALATVFQVLEKVPDRSR